MRASTISSGAISDIAPTIWTAISATASVSIGAFSISPSTSTLTSDVAASIRSGTYDTTSVTTFARIPLNESASSLIPSIIVPTRGRIFSAAVAADSMKSLMSGSMA